LAWSSGTLAQPAHASRPTPTSGQGVACPVGTPRGSGGGCAGQGGAAGFSPEMASGGAVEKMVRRGSVLRRRQCSGGRRGRRRGPTAREGDVGGEARYKRGRRRGARGSAPKARETAAQQCKDGVAVAITCLVLLWNLQCSTVFATVESWFNWVSNSNLNSF
jgi:hypothetical protein